MYSNIIGNFLNSLRALRLYVQRTEPVTMYEEEEEERKDPINYIFAVAVWAKEKGIDLKELWNLSSTDNNYDNEKNL